MDELKKLAIETKTKKDSGDRDSYLEAWGRMVKRASKLRPTLGSHAVNKIIDIHYYNFI